MSDDDPDFDIEAEFERELAALKDVDSNNQSFSGGVDGLLPLAPAGAHSFNTDDDLSSASDDEEPGSLHALRQAMQRRDEQMQAFSQELQQTHQQLSGVGFAAPGIPATEPAEGREHAAEAGASSSGQPADAGAAAAGGVAEPPDDAPSAGGVFPTTAEGRAALVRCLFPRAASSAAAQGSADAAASAAPGQAPSVLQDGPSASGAGDGLDAVARERQALMEEYRAQEAARQAERERQRAQAEAEAAAAAAVAAAAMRKAEEELERKRQQALARLQAEAAAAAAEHEAHVARAQAEGERQAREREELQARMAQQAADAAAREAERAAVQAQITEQVLERARRQLAARRICRAWRRYRAGPLYAARAAAACRIQACWRGRVDRRRAAQLRTQQAVMRGLEEAASKGLLEAMKQLAGQAQGVGLESAVQQRVAALEAQSRDAAEKLSAAAQQGGAMAFRAALAGVQRFPHLAQLQADCSELFAKRRAAAEAALQTAAADKPLAEVQGLCEAAGQLGLEAARLVAYLEEARRRDAAAGRLLLAAACAPAFDLQAYDQAQQRALHLGLKAEAAAAKHLLEKRRRALAARMQALGAALPTSASAAAAATKQLLVSSASPPQPLTAAAVARLCAEARALGMAGEASDLELRLQQRQLELQQQLERAAEHDSIGHCTRLLQRAEVLGMPHAMLRRAAGALSQRQAAAAQRLAAAASGGTLHQFLEARGGAIRAGCRLSELVQADRQLGRRRQQAAEGVAGSLRELLGRCSLEPASCDALAAVAQSVGPALGLGDPLGLLRRVEPASASASAAAAAAAPQGAAQPHAGVAAAGGRAEAAGQGHARAGAQGAPAAARRDGRGASGPGEPTASQRGASQWALVDALGHDPPAGVLTVLDAALQGGQLRPAPGSDAGAVRQALGALWRLCHSALQLGLVDAVALGLGALRMRCGVELAEGSFEVARVALQRDYWGALGLPTWEQVAALQAQHKAGGGGGGAQAQALAGPGPAGWHDAAAAYVWQRITGKQHGRAAAGGGGPIWAWPALDNPLALRELWRAHMPQLLGTSPHPHQPTAPKPMPPTPPTPAVPGPPPGRGVALSRTVILRAVPGATPATLPSLLKLDVSLEQLSSMAGLDVACPSLQCLHANVNQLTDLRGLQGLSGLQELSLKGNALCPKGTDGAPGLHPGAPLRRLVLDGNRLGSLTWLGACGAATLQALSCTDNCVAGEVLEVLPPGAAPRPGAGPEASGARLAALRTLRLAGNALTSLRGLGGRCPALTELDVSRNRLTALEGIDGCVCLQSLSASGNAISALPPGLALPHLRALDLSQNALATFGLPPAVPPLLPSLEHLNLQDNRITALGAMATMPGLTSLDLSFNQLQGLACLQALACLSRLAELQLGENPVAQWTPGYRPAVLALVPSLRELDHDGVGRHERARHVLHAHCSSPLVAVAGMRALRACTGAAAVVVAASAPAQAAGTAAAGGACGHRAFGSSLGLGSLGAVAQQVQQQLARGIGGQPGAGLNLAAPGLRHYSPCYSAAAHGGSAAAQHAAGLAADWLQRTERLWAAGGPTEAASCHSLQLAGVQRLQPATAAASSAASSLPAAPGSFGAFAAGTPATAAGRLHAACLDAPALRGFVGLAGALQGVSFGGRKPGASAPPASAQPEAQRALELEARAEDAAAAAAQQHLLDLRQHLQALPGLDGAAATTAAAGAPPGLPATLLQQPSYFLHRLHGAARGAAVIQAHWRGRAARRMVALMRSDQYQTRCHECAARIQACWRGHRARTGPELAAARARRRAQEQEDMRRKEEAAVKIQAYMRGHGVRTKLKAAVGAAKYVDEDEEELEGFDQDLDDMMGFLKPLEKLLEEEGPGPAPPQPPPLRPAALPPAGVLSAPSSFVAAAPPGAHGFGLPPGGGMPYVGVGVGMGMGPAGLGNSPVGSWVEGTMMGQRPHSPAQLPPLRTSQTLPAGSLPPIGGAQRPSPLSIGEPPGGHPPSVHAQASGVSLPSVSVPGHGGYGHGGHHHARVSGYGASEDGGDGLSRGGSVTPSSVAGSQVSPNEQDRQRRYLEKLQALMTEWGFKDLATAEAYYRRTMRKKNGDAKRKLEAKFRDPQARLAKLQQVVDQRPMLRPQDVMRPPAHAGARPLPLHAGTLQAPPSRPSMSGSEAGAAAGCPGNAPAAAGGRPRNLSSADGILAGSYGLPSPVPGGLHRSNSHGSAASALSAPAGSQCAPPGYGGGRPAGAGRGPDDDERMSVHSFSSAGGNPAALGNRNGMAAQQPTGRQLLPSMANNWVMSPSNTPPGSSGGGSTQRGAVRLGQLEVTGSVALSGRLPMGAPLGGKVVKPLEGRR